MEFLLDVLEWFGEPGNWTGQRGVLVRVGEHVWVSVTSVGVASVLGLAPALWLAHHARGAFITNAVVNVGRAVPSFGIVVVAGVISVRLGFGMAFWPTFVALVALALPPIFTNGYTAIRQVDRAAVDAARGMGMTEAQVLMRIEVPLGLPVILAGLRIATAQVIATATIGAVLTFGGLGRFIIDGFARRDNVAVFAGAVLVAVLALVSEGVFALIERASLPRGVGRLVRKEEVVDTASAA